MSGFGQATAGAPQPRVLVLQLGARLHYAVPAVYARNGALCSLYTDSCASVGALSVVRRLVPNKLRNARLQRMLGRTLPADIPLSRVRVETFATLQEHVARELLRRDDALVTTHERLRRRIHAAGFEGANCLYCLDNGDLSLMRAAREAGLALVYEQIIHPEVGRILRDERARFPGIEAQDSEELVEAGIARDIETFQLADRVICASEFVRDGVSSLTGQSAHPAVVPYGIRPDWLDVPRSPIPGRILFVGTVGLRKGNHYLAEASRLLRARGVPCEVRVVGPFDPKVVARPEFAGPTYVGQVPREVVRAEFARADVFTMPSLAESFAIAHLEAFACGLPVVTTPNCGSQVRDGESGFIVPIRDARALADRLETLVTDRELRSRMSRNAVQRATELTWDRFGAQLLAETQEAMKLAATR